MIPPTPSHTHSLAEQLMPLKHMSRYLARHVFLIAPYPLPPELLKGQTVHISAERLLPNTPTLPSPTPGQKNVAVSSSHFSFLLNQQNCEPNWGLFTEKKTDWVSDFGEHLWFVIGHCPDVVVSNGGLGGGEGGLALTSAQLRIMSRAMVSSGSLSSRHRCSQDYTKLH